MYQGTLSPANRIGGRFGNHISDQGLVSRIRNECFLLNSKANNPIKNAQRTWAGISPNRYSSGKQAYERYSTRLVRKEMQIKATTTCHFTLTGRPLRQQQWKVTNVGEDVRKQNPYKLLQVLQNGALATESALIGLQQVKRRITIRPSIIHNRQKVKVMQMPIDKWINKLWSTHIMEYDSAMKRNEDTCHYSDDLQKHCAKWKKADTTGHGLYGPFHRSIQNGQTHRDKPQWLLWPGGRGEGKRLLNGHGLFLLG